MINDRNRTTRSRCPSERELADFSAGKVAVAAADAIAAHVATCSQCQAVLDECERNIDPMVAELRQSFGNSPIEEVEVERVVARVESIRHDGCDSSVRRAASEDEVEGTPGNPLQIRCPYCHEISSLVGVSADETTVCPKCAGEFGLALSEADNVALHPGGRVAHYELLESLGEGSFGTVWKARDTVLQRLVALKLPRRGQLRGKNIEAFLREARIAAQVRHPGIVHVYEVGVEKDTVYLASELIEGQSLAASMAQHRYSAGETARLIESIAEAVHAAHVAGMVHRDLKPANILLDRSGNPYVTDFGLACHTATEVVATVEGKILGTPVYMSPEQAKGNVGEVDVRSDIYSMGVILYELLTGRPPFDGDVHILVSKILLNEPPLPRVLNSSLPRDLETICLKCLEKRPGKRYQSAEDLATDLRLFLEGKPVHARRVTRTGRLWRWMRRKPVLASSLTITVFLLACTVAALALGHWKAASAYRIAKQNLYFHSIISAQQRWQTNDPRAAESILDQCPTELRDFEWGHLKHLVRTPLRRLSQAGGVLAYSADGNTLVTCGSPMYELKVWDARTDQCMWRMKGHKDYALAIDIHPTESLAVSAGRDDKTVRLWDTSTGQEFRVFRGHESPVEHCAIAPDGETIVSCDTSGTVKTWDLASGKELSSRPLELRRLRALAFSPTDYQFAVANRRGEESEILIYDYASDEVVAKVPTFGSTIGGVAYSSDGTRLAVGEMRKAIRIWQLLPTLNLLETIPGPVSTKCRVTFDGTGELVAAEALDGTICVWDVSRGQTQLALRGHSRPVYDIAFSPDGNELAAGTGTNGVCIWDITTEQGSVAYQGGKLAVQDLAVSPNGEHLAAGFGDGSARIWERATRRLIFESIESRPICSVAFSPDSQCLAVVSGDTSVKIYDTTSGKMKFEFREHNRPVHCVAFSADGKLAASAGMGRAIQVWDAETGQVCRTLQMGQGTAIRRLAFHNDSRRLVAGGASPDVGLFDAITGKTVWMKHWRLPLRVWDLNFSPDGKLLAIARGDGSIRVRNVEDGALVQRFGDLAENLPVALAFSPNGRRLVSATARTAVSLWDPASGRNVLTISRCSSTFGAAAFCPDGQAVVTGDIHGTVRLWPTIDD